MQTVLEALDAHNIDKEAESLARFYESVKRRAAGIDADDAKQQIVVELYDKFFRNAFPKMTERLGIVYTPVEVVDFILHSVNELLQSEFGQTLGSEGVHILDPFTGTGTFITRLLQSGLIEPEELERKYTSEIHANEIVLLAYYIAAINIEAAYHSVAGGDYRPFEGICLTDTFQLYEQDKDLLAELMPDNSNRRTRQKALPVRVIVGNPPYSKGQQDANENAANLEYKKLDGRIRETYVARASTTDKSRQYDSYIRAIRWASDRLGEAGIIGFVTNAGFAEARSSNGLRKCLVEEFASIHVFHLRGRRGKQTAGERAKQEGGQIFGSGSGAAIAISLLVKNPNSAESGKIFFHDIGAYLSREDKLNAIREFSSLNGISQKAGWSPIVADEHGDWLGQRDKSFEDHIALGDKSGEKKAVFASFSLGVATARDGWAFNFGKEALTSNIARMIRFYSDECERFEAQYKNTARSIRKECVDNFINVDQTKISWSRALKSDLEKQKQISFDSRSVVQSLYRPFTMEWMYYSRILNEMVYKMPRIFPLGTEKMDNSVICVSAGGGKVPFSALMSRFIPSLHTVDVEGSQCFPRYLYDAPPNVTNDLFPQDRQAAGRCDAITDEGLAHFQAAYPLEPISKDDLFHYVYGMLHSEDYRERFADNLSKELPRIPAVKTAEHFWAFVKAGERLGDLHCDFESAELAPVTIQQGDLRLAHISEPERYFRVEKMKFGGKRGSVDKTTVIYNGNITMTGIPLEAYDYVVNGKPALEWVMERQVVKTDKASQIVNDANRYAIETVGDPAYPLKLFQRVITVSLETMKIVRSLPPLGDLS